jgi:hypothetical protein
MNNTSSNVFTSVRQWIGSHKLVTALIGLVVIGGTSALTGSTSSTQPAATAQTQAAAEAPTTPTLSATQATADFKDVMSTAVKADLVSSYQFNETDRVIYVTGLWYSQPVTFKKDFLAKIAMDQEAMTGKHFFEVRDEDSNEKVAEVTAFSGSLEVYK